MDRLLLSRRAQLLRALHSRLIACGLGLVAVASVLAVLFIFWFIAKDAIPFFRERGLGEFLLGKRWNPSGEPATFGARPIFVGTLYVTLGAALFAVPLGILSAVCLSDMLPEKLRQPMKTLVEILAAIPSVVYGFFAVSVMAPFLQTVGEPYVESGTNLLTASIVLGIMALPTVASLSEDALQAAGRELREGSYALGATRAETLLKVIIPAAASGIAAAVILGVMRAFGETMVVWMAAGNSPQEPTPWYNIFASVRTLTATIAGEMGEADQATGSVRYHALFAMAFALLVVSFAGNTLGEWIVTRQAKRR